MALLNESFDRWKSSNEISIDYSSSLREKITNLLIILVYSTFGVILYNFPYIKYNSNNNNIPKPVQTIY